MGPIGVFGGTFDPIHLGHLRTAYELLNEFTLAEVRFVPCRIPHHDKAPSASSEQRLQMVRAAIAAEPGFSVDERELRREGASYSVDTLESLRTDFPERTLVLLIGLDAFIAFTSWHRWQDIIQLAHIIVARRPGSEISDAGPVGPLMDRYGTLDASDLYRAPAGKIIIHTVTQLEIASSTIRAMVGRGCDPRFLVAESVRKIIEESGCYANQNDTGGTT
jgi:nicotinate-nucleotide adenylyltransferase